MKGGYEGEAGERRVGDAFSVEDRKAIWKAATQSWYAESKLTLMYLVQQASEARRALITQQFPEPEQPSEAEESDE